MADRDKALRGTGLAALCKRLKEYFKKTDTAGASLISLTQTVSQGFEAAEESIAAAAKTAQASGVTFEDGETFQQKYEDGQLTGPKGDDGQPGKAGADGAPGDPGPKGDPGTTPKVSASLPTEGWTATTDQDFLNAGYAVMYDLAAPDATEDDGADCRFSPASLDPANTAGVCPTVNVIAGKIRFYAAKAPAAQLTLEYQLIKG